MIKNLKSTFYKTDQYDVRNYSTWVLAFLSLGFLYCIIAIMSLPLLYFEQEHAQGNIHNYADAFWTLQMSASTIGFGDHYPVTLGGRTIVAMVFYFGVGLVGFLGAMIAEKVLGFADTSVKNRELRKQNANILAHNLLIEKKLNVLMAQLDKAVGEQGKS